MQKVLNNILVIFPDNMENDSLQILDQGSGMGGKMMFFAFCDGVDSIY